MDRLFEFAFPQCCVAYFLVYEAWQMISPEKVNFFFKIPFLTSYWWSWEHCPNVNHWFLAAGHSFTTLLTSQQASVFHKHTYYYFSLHISNDCSALHKWQNTRIFDFHFLELYFWTVTTYQFPKKQAFFQKSTLDKIQTLCASKRGCKHVNFWIFLSFIF